jgi:glycosyltransferase involved in cell wall biosynthesis
MVLAEAGAAVLPLVSTYVGAISELVRDGETGRLIEAGDTDGLVDALAELLTSEEKRLTYGRGARMLVERDHDAAANVRRIISVLREAAR